MVCLSFRPSVYLPACLIYEVAERISVEFVLGFHNEGCRENLILVRIYVKLKQNFILFVKNIPVYTSCVLNVMYT
jgi:hypothetical protein